MKHTLRYYLKRYSFYLGGDQPLVAWVKRLRSVFGAFIGLGLVLLAAKYLRDLSGLDEWLMGKCLTSICSASKSDGSALGCHCWQYTICLGGDFGGAPSGWAIDCFAFSCQPIDLGDVYLALPTPTCCRSSAHRSIGWGHALSLCILPCDDRLYFASNGWGGLQ